MGGVRRWGQGPGVCFISYRTFSANNMFLLLNLGLNYGPPLPLPASTTMTPPQAPARRVFFFFHFYLPEGVAALPSPSLCLHDDTTAAAMSNCSWGGLSTAPPFDNPPLPLSTAH